MLEVHGFGGVVVTPHVLSTQAGIHALNRGGSAVDAAIAANAVQGVVAPETCGIGGDLFALVHDAGGVTALNASGRAGSKVSATALRDEGLTSIPQHHPAGVTVPGCVAGWFELAERYGRLSMKDNLGWAIDLARNGFPASTEYSAATHRMAEFLRGNADGAQLLPGGQPPLRGERVRRPNLAASLERIAAEGPTAFYTGDIAASICDAVGGLITPEDVAGYTADWVQPLAAEVFGVKGWTIPPNSQGYLTLATLKIFESLTPTMDPDDPLWTHLLVESYRAVAAERDDLVADQAYAPMGPDELLDPERLMVLAGRISMDSVSAQPGPADKPPGTMYLCTVDKEGMGVSLIQSNFRGIGSGIGPGRSGFVLHDRGAGFDLRPGHPNELGPGKRPLHTLSPSLWTMGDRLRTVLGTRGGHQQPQFVSQMAALLFGAGHSPGQAQSHPRWNISWPASGTTALDVESTTPNAVIEGLTGKGHAVEAHGALESGWGPVSVIDVNEHGLRAGAPDPRVDTTSAAVC
jgi:gamma-glutamyltranspeptidase / glutathione hydrolase